MKHLSLDEWIKLNPEVLKMKCPDCDNSKIMCPHCDGEGEITCYECEHSYECDECNGTGIEYCATCENDLPKTMYTEQLIKDKLKVEALNVK